MDEIPERKKSALPKWLLLGCGGGCLLAVLGVVAAVVVFGPQIKRMLEEQSDPEVQWPALGEVLAFDERPDLKIQKLPVPFMDAWELMDLSNGYRVQLSVVTSDLGRGNYEQAFDTSPALGIGAPVNPEVGEIEIQGRTARAMRFSGVKDGLGLGAGLRCDLTEIGPGAKMLWIDLRRLGGAEAITDEEFRSFFEPFDVWRDR